LAEVMLLRLEEGLRAQGEQQQRSDKAQRDGGANELCRENEPRDFESNVSSSPPPKAQTLSSWLLASTHVAPIGESTRSDQPQIPVESSFRSPSVRKLGLLVCVLLLVIGGATLAISLKARTVPPNDIQASGSQGHSPPTAGLQPVELAEPPRMVSVPLNYDSSPQSSSDAAQTSATTPPLPALLPAQPNEPLADTQRITPPGPERAAAAQTPVPVEKAKVTRGKPRTRQARSGHPGQAAIPRR
jgi:hypothetical protein